MHHVDHVTVLLRGGIRIAFSDGRPSEDHWVYDDPKDGPMVKNIEIDKDVYHQITALRDHTVYQCTFALVGHMTDREAGSMQAGLCDHCEDGSGCSLEAMAAFGDGSRVA